MATRKRNEWLEAEESDDGGRGYDSEEESRGKTLAGRWSKRRKLDSDPAHNSDDESSRPFDEQDNNEEVNEASLHLPVVKAVEGSRLTLAPTPTPNRKKALKKLEPLTQKQFLASQKAARRTGVIYISRVPPFMKPQTVKNLLSPHGAIGRIFLSPEDSAAHTRRVKAGGNKKRSFTDGWVEFLDKKNAKLVAETLNSRIIGGKKSGWYHDDVWNIKYLKGFKWYHLTEQIANENAERAARLRAEIAQTTKENKMFLENIERAKMLEGMESKQRKKGLDAGKGQSALVMEEANAGTGGKELRRQFRQNKVKQRKDKDQGSTERPVEVQRVLSKIF
ncbi:hypothetical protein K432DRAFT_383141 [Lepidopterella palustris CBS 459.81]|uniref:18S rRNA factor 2 n=1 Tax=Lepidopterella palustris CBS 459.81 TaxID=1314670 RepID=A0A8E2JE61_9PEZI|nr:hypothetical protein K432DRAFT_383141 [Lepidopterella palustris CBS 459.81]